MADENYKLAKFQAAVFAEIDMKTVQIKQEAELLKEKELEKNKDIQLDNSYNYIQQKSTDIKKKYKCEVARFSLDKKRELLIRRNEIADRVMNNVALRLTSFLNTPEYVAFLAKKLTSFIKENDVSSATLQLGVSDFSRKDEIAKSLPVGFQITLNDNIKLGGFIVLDTQSGTYFDETLEQYLIEQKAYFMQHSKLAV